MTKFVVGNWKMNGALHELDAIAAAARANPGVEVAICPPFTMIAAAAREGLAVGAQDCQAAPAGAHTGCVSVPMLREAGATLVIVGHSERRADQHETSAEVRAKAEAALAGGLAAILCVGETEAERETGDAVATVTSQLTASLPEARGHLAIAYEPVWAIGTGRTPTVADITEMHAAIRAIVGPEVRILYGGSVKPSNAAELLAIANVDGALVGGASLKAADFVPIIQAAD